MAERRPTTGSAISSYTNLLERDVDDFAEEELDFLVDSLSTTSATQSEHQSPEIWSASRTATTTPVPTPSPSLTVVEDEALGSGFSVSSQVSVGREFEASPLAIYAAVEVCARGAGVLRCRSILEWIPHTLHGPGTPLQSSLLYTNISP